MDGYHLPPSVSLLAALLNVVEGDKVAYEDLGIVLEMVDPHDVADLVHGTSRQLKNPLSLGAVMKGLQ